MPEEVSHRVADGPDLPDLCALQNRNETHGLPKNTPFHGEIAHSMWEQAVAVDRKRVKKTDAQPKERNAPVTGN